MSLERSSQLPGGYQIIHGHLGIFQGTAAGLACWHPSFSVPEYGLCRFETQAKAQAYMSFSVPSFAKRQLDANDLSIEDFHLFARRIRPSLGGLIGTPSPVHQNNGVARPKTT